MDVKKILEMRALNNSPYLQQEMARRRVEQQQSQMAQLAGQLYGDPTQGTGLFDPKVPVDVRHHLFNKRMLESGLGGFIEQWAGNQGRMQDSAMSNMGAMERQVAGDMYQKPPEAYQKYLLTLDPGQEPSGRGFAAFLQSSKPAMFASPYVTPEQSMNLRYVDSGAEVLPGTPWDRIAGNVRAVSQTDREGEQKGRAVANTIQDIDNMLFGDNGIYAGVKDDKTFLGKVGSVVANNYDYWTQDDPRVKIYTDSVNARLGLLAKNLTFETGALAESDVARIQGLVPVLVGLHPDRPSVAKAKIERLKKLEEAVKSKGGKIQKAEFEALFKGLPTSSGFEPQTPEPEKPTPLSDSLFPNVKKRREAEAKRDAERKAYEYSKLPKGPEGLPIFD